MNELITKKLFIKLLKQFMEILKVQSLMKGILRKKGEFLFPKKRDLQIIFNISRDVFGDFL